MNRLQMYPSLAVECIEVIKDSTDLSLTMEQFMEIMEDDPGLCDQLVSFNSPWDTMDREALMCAIAKKITGREWPTYGDGQEVYKEFIDTFYDLAEEKGYVICL